MRALRACKVLQMAAVITAVNIGLGRLGAMVASSNDATIVRMVDRNGASIVKDIAESIPESPLCFGVLSVRNNSSVELIDFFESVTKHERRELFAADTSRAVRQNGLIAGVGKMCTYPFGKFPEGLDVWTDSATEMSDVKLVIRPSVENDHVSSFDELLPLDWIQALTGDLIGVRGQVSPKRHQFLLYPHEELAKRMAVGFINFKGHRGKTCIGCQSSAITVTVSNQSRHCSVESFGGHKDAPLQAE